MFAGSPGLAFPFSPDPPDRHFFGEDALERVRRSCIGVVDLEAGIFSRDLEAGISSRYLKAGISLRDLEAGISSRDLEAGISSRDLEAGISSRVQTDWPVPLWK